MLSERIWRIQQNKVQTHTIQELSWSKASKEQKLICIKKATSDEFTTFESLQTIGYIEYAGYAKYSSKFKYSVEIKNVRANS